MQRRERLLGNLRIRESRGLEIGPRSSPLVAKTESDIRYVDYTTTEELRASQFDPSVNIDDIVDVDIVWGQQKLSEVVGTPVDYVVASHVIEHVPDLIGWLLELRGSLRVGGVLGLAIPDRRCTFDYWRGESRVAEMVEAYLLEYRRPSLRQIFDASFHGIAHNPAETGSTSCESDSLPESVRCRMADAYKLARDVASNPRYVDAHCWVFTPRSFLDAIDLLDRIGLFPYKIDAFFTTQRDQIEFQVRLCAIAPEDRREGTASIVAARSLVAAAVDPHSTQTSNLSALKQEIVELHRRLAVVQSSRPFQAGQRMRALLTRLLNR